MNDLVFSPQLSQRIHAITLYRSFGSQSGLLFGN